MVAAMLFAATVPAAFCLMGCVAWLMDQFI